MAHCTPVIDRADGIHGAAVGPASTQIRQAMQVVLASEEDVDEPEEALEPVA